MAVGIDFGTTHLRLCRVTWRGGPKVTGLVEQPITVEPESQAYWTTCQRSLEQVRQYGEINDAILGVTGRDLNLNYSRYAKLPLGTLRKMVGFELDTVEGGENMLAW